MRKTRIYINGTKNGVEWMKKVIGRNNQVEILDVVTGTNERNNDHHCKMYVIKRQGVPGKGTNHNSRTGYKQNGKHGETVRSSSGMYYRGKGNR
ncbi:hypothetical protein [Butyrivibrio sp. INlla16]|uniref:hypothetical protein n=1 Tax=Butyrivibrio sp. INlla16 TaxID=1520807 RepID=UPI0008841F2A|nr:hypothetical protein [Butyrivibrio sp. INlla16]SDB64682.1 hypothetical protein SAMN02910263_03630 [Butyrivibrio sp. INlla16]